jgi:hypothetical protein
MDFSSAVPADIDFSPSPCAGNLTLALDSDRLVDVDYGRLERFWRVWHGDRATYAPRIKELTLVLRPSFRSGCLDLVGINQFLDFYQTHVEPNCSTTGLYIYLDSLSSIYSNQRTYVLDEPQLLLAIPAVRRGTTPPPKRPF